MVSVLCDNHFLLLVIHLWHQGFPFEWNKEALNSRLFSNSKYSCLTAPVRKRPLYDPNTEGSDLNPLSWFGLCLDLDVHKYKCDVMTGPNLGYSANGQGGRTLCFRGRERFVS